MTNAYSILKIVSSVAAKWHWGY